MSARIVVLGCGAAKRRTPKPVLARELYTGSLFLDRLAYADALGGPDWIASAKHGLVDPCEPLAAYDEQLAAETAPAWAERVAAHMLEYIVETGETSVHVVALVSGLYASWVPLVEGDRGGAHVTVEVFGRGLPIGKLRRALREATAAEARAVYERQASEVLSELPTWADDEEVSMPVGALRALLASGRAA